MNRLTEVRYTPDTSASSTYSLFQLFWLENRLVLYWQVDYPSVTTSKRYVSTDETGRPYELVNWPSSGNPAVYWGINQNAWGFDNTLNFGVGTIYQPILFAGQYQDVETVAYENDGATVHRPALALNGFRTYDPFVGGYLQVDPLVDSTRSSYLYVDSNPVGNIDPDGLDWVYSDGALSSCTQVGGWYTEGDGTESISMVDHCVTVTVWPFPLPDDPQPPTIPPGQTPPPNGRGSSGFNPFNSSPPLSILATCAQCDRDFERDSEVCRKIPNETKAGKIARAACWVAIMAVYADCLKDCTP
jgi:RHS repeat-associated protein